MASPGMEHISVPHIEMKLEKLSPIISRNSFMARKPCSFDLQMAAALRMCQIIKIFTQRGLGRDLEKNIAENFACSHQNIYVILRYRYPFLDISSEINSHIQTWFPGYIPVSVEFRPIFRLSELDCVLYFKGL